MAPTRSAAGQEQRKERAAIWSIVASVAITLGKGAAGLASGSLALISDAAHSLLDVAATTVTWLALRAAHKPADEEHQYGHGKYELLAALIETAFLFVLSGAVAFEGVRRLWAGEADVVFSWAAVGVLCAAIVVDSWRWWSLRRIARETGSEALEADALHFSSDLVNSVLVLAALGAAAAGYPQVDSVVAIGVAIFIAIAGFRLAQRTLATLLDTAPKGLAEQVRSRAEGVAGVVSVKRVRVRPAGGRAIGEILVDVSRTLPLERVAAIKQRIAAAVAEDLPDAELTITADPVQLDDESIMERVMLTAARLRLPVHHITVQNLEGRLAVSFDVEVDGAMTLARAHAGRGPARGGNPGGARAPGRGREPYRAAGDRPSRRTRGGCRNGRPDRFDARREHRRGRDPGGAQRPGSRDAGGPRRELSLPGRAEPQRRRRARARR